MASTRIWPSSKNKTTADTALRVLKIDDDIADNVVTDPHKDDDKFFWEK